MHEHARVHTIIRNKAIKRLHPQRRRRIKQSQSRLARFWRWFTKPRSTHGR